MPCLFISRQLTVSSQIRAWCTEHQVSLTDRSLLRFSRPDRIEWPNEPFEWVFFYSSRAVTYFIDQYPGSLDNISLACMGRGTARSLQKHQLEPAFVGSGNPREVAAAFAESALGQTVLFPRAEHSRRSVERALSQHIATLDVVVYRNEATPHSFDQSFTHLIFTSPLNVQAFLQENAISEDAQVVAIGSSTAKALRDHGFEALVAERPDEESVVNLLSHK